MPTNPRRCRGRAHERRGYAVPTALMLVVFCGVAALVIDLGYGRLIQAQLQAVSDASAHAGAMQVNWTEAGLLDARRAAIAVAAANTAHGGPVTVPDANVETGVWDHDAATFTPSSDAAQVNAVRVLARIGEIGTWFARPAFRRPSIAASGRATAVRMPPPIACAVLANSELHALGGIVTDSYFSPDGPYDASTAGAEGSLCANAHLDVGGDAEIHGDVVVGRGGEIVTHGSSVDITGRRVYPGSKFVLPFIDPSDAEADNDNDTVGLTSSGRDPWKSGGIRLSSADQLTLGAGVYVFASLRITGSASLVLTGPTEIWVTGEVRVGGTGIVNTGADPHDLTLYVTGDRAVMGGTSDFHGSLIAPEADVELVGTHDFFGIVIGETVDIQGDVVLHADVSLMEPHVQIQRWIALVD